MISMAPNNITAHAESVSWNAPSNAPPTPVTGGGLRPTAAFSGRTFTYAGLNFHRSKFAFLCSKCTYYVLYYSRIFCAINLLETLNSSIRDLLYHNL